METKLTDREKLLVLRGAMQSMQEGLAIMEYGIELIEKQLMQKEQDNG